MPRRNLYLIFGSLIVSLVCYRTADVTHYGRYLTLGLDEIERRNLEKIDRHELFNAAMEGMVGKLDAHSEFETRGEKARRFLEILDSQYKGIGIEVGLDPQSKKLTINNVMVDTPAYRSNLRPADQIAAINHQSTDGLSLDDAMRKMRDPQRDSVDLTILRDGQTLEVPNVPREEIRVATVLGDRRQESDDAWVFTLQDDPQFGYIRITGFGEQTDKELDATLHRLAEQNVRTLILDLRNNPGGLLLSAVHTCEQFVKQGVIVTTRGRDRQILEKHDASGKAPYADWKLAVLINGNSASASEIVAACLQDYGRAAIVGQRSYGKGTVQQVIDMESGNSKLKLTIADYWRPSNRNIHRRKDAQEGDEWGVTPDKGLEVKIDDDQLKRLLEYRHRRDQAVSAQHRGPAPTEPLPPRSEADPQLQRAVDYLHQQLEKK